MSASVRISRKDAVELVAICEGRRPFSRDVGAVVDRLRAAIRAKPSPKRQAFRKAREAGKKEKAALRGVAVSDVRAVAVMRADGRCENPECSAHFGYVSTGPGELDHFFGRARVLQSVGNCWMLCRNCHREKTGGRPSPAAWLERFRAFAIHHGYTVEAVRCGQRIDALSMVAEAESIGAGTR